MRVVRARPGARDERVMVVPDHGKAPSEALRRGGLDESLPVHGGHRGGAWKRLYRTAPARARFDRRVEGLARRRADHGRGVA